MNVPSNGSGRNARRAFPVPKLIVQGSLEKKLALTSTTLVRRRSLRNVTSPPTVSATGTWYRMLATRRTRTPSISIGTTGSWPQASSTGESDANDDWKPVIGSNESWSRIERRTSLRCSASFEMPPLKSHAIWPTTRSDSDAWLSGFVVSVRLTSAVAPGARSLRFADEAPNTRAGATSVRSERLVTVPTILLFSSRRSAVTLGPVVCASARTVRSEP